MAGLGRVRVLDLGWVWAGPLVGSVFAELGADVVKVESSTRFDPYRLRGVEKTSGLTTDIRRESSPSFHKLNGNKRSIGIDLRQARGRELFLSLAGKADLVVENFSAGTLRRMELPPSRLLQENPALVIVSMSAGGQEGRWKDLKAYALITTALAGLESLVRYDGEPPIGAPTWGAADPTTSAYGVLAALSALKRVQATGKGCHIDLSGVESVVGLLGYSLLQSQVDSSDGLPMVEWTLPCKKKDTWVTCVVTDEASWNRLGAKCAADEWPVWISAGLPREDLAQAERLAADWSRTRSVAEVVMNLKRSGVASAPVMTVEERNHVPPISDVLREVEHPVTGGEVVHPSGWGSRVDPLPAPLLGQHSREILREWLDLGDEAIDRLIATQVLV